MLSTPHLLVGAAIGSQIGGAPGAFVFGAISHLVLDAIPHTDEDLLEEPGHKRIMPADYAAVILDIVVGIGFVFYFTLSPDQLTQNLLAGAFGGISPDLLSNVPFWSPQLIKLPILKQLHWLHHKFSFRNNGHNKLFGVLTQFVVIIIAVIILMK